MTSTTDYPAFLAAARDLIGDDHVSADPATRIAYGTSELATQQMPPEAIVEPDSTAAVRRLVLAANRFAVPLYPVSAGQNLGLGRMSAPRPGAVLMHLGRMNRILDYDRELGYAVIEPGVTFEQLEGFLTAEGDLHMIDPTTGPPNGSVLANTLEKGGGATMAGDHVAHSCGLEVVLGDGRLLRTGDGALDTARTWHLSRYGFGPVLDGLFLQSNLGVVTRMGVWLARRPAVIRCEFLSYPDDGDLGRIVETARPILAAGRIPSTFKATSGLYALASQTRYPQADLPDRRALPDEARVRLQNEHGVGAWLVSFAVYGEDPTEVAGRADRVSDDLVAAGGTARRLDPAEADRSPILQTQRAVYSGRPTSGELEIVNWRHGGGIISLTPTVPMSGGTVNELQLLSRRILADAGLEFMAAYVCTPRTARALHSIVFDRHDPEECRRARAAAEHICDSYADLGWPVARAPVDMQEREMARRPEFRQACLDIRAAFDPNGVLAPGRYGLATPDNPSAGRPSPPPWTYGF